MNDVPGLKGGIVKNLTYFFGNEKRAVRTLNELAAAVKADADHKGEFEQALNMWFRLTPSEKSLSSFLASRHFNTECYNNDYCAYLLEDKWGWWQVTRIYFAITIIGIPVTLIMILAVLSLFYPDMFSIPNGANVCKVIQGLLIIIGSGVLSHLVASIALHKTLRQSIYCALVNAGYAFYFDKKDIKVKRKYCTNQKYHRIDFTFVPGGVFYYIDQDFRVEIKELGSLDQAQIGSNNAFWTYMERGL